MFQIFKAFLWYMDFFQLKLMLLKSQISSIFDKIFFFIFKVLKEIYTAKHKIIILDCNRNMIREVLIQAQQIGMMSEEYYYLLTSIDAHTVDLHRFKVKSSQKVSSWKTPRYIERWLKSYLPTCFYYGMNYKKTVNWLFLSHSNFRLGILSLSYLKQKSI